MTTISESKVVQQDETKSRQTSLAGCDHGQRRRIVIESLLTEIFQGRLRAGERLVIQDLASRIGTSPTPIREALVALEGIGIVALVPNRGAVVRQVTSADVRDICQVRKALECEAIRLACGQIDLELLQEMAVAFRRLQLGSEHSHELIEETRMWDSRLHDSISESCGNRFLSQEIGRLKLLFRAFRDVAWEHDRLCDDPLRFADEAQEHLAIVEALLEEDLDSAVEAMARHIDSGVEHWSRALPNS